MASLNRLIVSKYENLRGVDFSSPPSLVDRSRSPYCLNLMPDSSLHPVKRPGWETVYNLEGCVHNIWFCTIAGIKYTLCHCGDKIYSLGDEIKVLKSGISDEKGCGFYAFKGETPGFYILTGKEYIVFDGEKTEDVFQQAYVPLITIAKYPSGGGESYEDINMLTPMRKEGFIGTENDLIYQLGADNLESVDKIEVLQQDGGHVILENGVDYTADLLLGKITFLKAYPSAVTGQDNIFVTYSKTIEGYREKITGCTVCTQFGLGGENRVFVTGNSLCPHKDFWSGIYDPSYFSDLCYAVIGSGQTAIMGYLKLGNELGIVKEENGQDISIFLRSTEKDAEGKAMFIVKSGTSSVGAISKNCFAVMNDEPLFLSSRGIFAVTGSLITSQKLTVNRSYQIDSALTNEENLSAAVACIWKDFYVLSVNGNCYILDSRQIVAAENGEKNSRYEAYFWNNVPATCLAVDGNKLWFGTVRGEVRRFKEEKIGRECYSDDGQAIYAVWKTPVEDEGRIDRFKTLQRKGCLVTLKPFESSSCKVYCCVDGGKKQFVQQKILDISQMFKKMNFTRLTFNTNQSPQEIYFYTRKRRYKRIQFVFENNDVNEGFGIQNIIKLYKIENYSKNGR